MPSLTKSISNSNKSKDSKKNGFNAASDETETLRVAILGTEEVGKTSFVNRLTMKYVPESHYPTLKVTNWLFQFEPVNELTRLILDEHKHERMLYNVQNTKNQTGYKVNQCIYQTPNLSDHLIVSNSLFEREINNFVKFKKKYCLTNAEVPVDSSILMQSCNPYYGYNEYFTGLFDNQSLKSTISNSSHSLKPTRTTDTSNSFLINPTMSPISSFTSNNNLSNPLDFDNINKVNEAEEEEEDDDDIIPIYNAGHNFMITKQQTLRKYTPILPKMYTPPYISNILIDIIDTPAFNVSNIIPFLEVSLFRDNLGVPYLQNERNRRDYNENIGTMMTFSGSSELNGKIDAYVLVYSCYPTITEPPLYNVDSNESLKSSNIDQNNNKKIDEQEEKEKEEILLKDIITMKEILCDAWRNYKEYINNWKKGDEGDVYSLMYNLRKKWEKIPISNSKNNNNRIDEDMPPIVIVATHTLNELTSPILLNEGKKLATEWGCSFIAVDNYNDYQCEEALGVVVAESVYYKQKKKLKK